MMLKFFNTLSRKKETFTPYNPKKVKMYACGPTVYDFAHIGNFRTYVFEDLLRRTLKYFGYEIEHVMNITDVDDKTIKGAIAKGVGLQEYCQPYIDAFFQDLEQLGIESVEHNPKATDYIDAMIRMIETLLAKNMAYVGKDSSVYFSIQHFPTYGKLSHLKLNDLKGGARVSSDEYDKEVVGDFCLWKGYDATRDGLIYWDSPWGKGRPGWHLECSCMALEILDSKIDIHCGAVDNIFPHHENEIAQSEGCTGKTFVQFWLHSEHLIVDGKKMSKSLGNFYTLRDLLARGYTGRQLRFLLLSQHYRTQVNFTLEGLAAAKHSLRRIDEFVDRLKQCQQEIHSTCQEVLTQVRTVFNEALADDLNISSALAALFEFIRDINAKIDSKNVSLADRENILNFLKEIDQVLNIFAFERAFYISPSVQALVQQRDQARQEKNWKEADRLRDLIQSHGFVVEDSPEGSKVKPL